MASATITIPRESANGPANQSVSSGSNRRRRTPGVFRGWRVGSGLGDPGSYRLVVDGVSGPILEAGIKALAPDGICVCYGITSAPDIAIEVRPFMFSGQAKVMGFYLYSQAEITPPSDNLPRLLRLVAAKL